MKENVSPIADLSPQEETVAGVESEVKGKGSSSPVRGSPTRKSLIPVRTPPKGVTKLVSERKPLTPIQAHKSKMVGRQSSSTVVASSPPSKKIGLAATTVPAASGTSRASITPTSPLAKTKTSSSKIARPSSPLTTKTLPSFSSTPLSSPITSAKNKPGVAGSINKTGSRVDKEVQTDHPDLALITGDEPPPEYWKDLAETRRQALEEALTENEELHKKVEELEKENNILEEMVEHAKQMAEMISSITEEDSGIAADASLRSEDNSRLLTSSTATADDDEDDD